MKKVRKRFEKWFSQFKKSPCSVRVISFKWFPNRLSFWWAPNGQSPNSQRGLDEIRWSVELHFFFFLCLFTCWSFFCIQTDLHVRHSKSFSSSIDLICLHFWLKSETKGRTFQWSDRSFFLATGERISIEGVCRQCRVICKSHTRANTHTHPCLLDWTTHSRTRLPRPPRPPLQPTLLNQLWRRTTPVAFVMFFGGWHVCVCACLNNLKNARVCALIKL